MTSTQDPGRTSPGGSPHQPPSSGRTEALRAPLATILGHTQHLKRCFLAGKSLTPDDYLSALSTIERSVWALEGHLRVLENRRTPEATPPTTPRPETS